MIAAALACAAVAAWPSRAELAASRLAALRERPKRRRARIGIAATVAAIASSLRHGATVREAFETQAGRSFATASITARRAELTLAGRAYAQEQGRDVRRVARQIEAACALGEELGGGTARCLDAVAASWRRTRLLEGRRREVRAAPEASVKLMTALPALTAAIGEALGAKPLAWLTGSMLGWLCLTAGALCYALGLAWMRRLLAPLEDGRPS